MTTILILAVLVLALRSSSAAWVPIDWQTIPKAAADDDILVEYLIAPLLEEDFGNLLGDLDMFHGAISFTNRNTSYSITMNYDADDFFRASLFPEIVTSANGTKSLKWENEGACFIYLGVNRTYWTSYYPLIHHLPGSLFNRFLFEVIPQINTTWEYYNMFSIMDHWGGTVYLHSWDCFDFVVTSLRQLASWGAEIDNSQNVNRDYTNIYAREPPLRVTDLYYLDPHVRSDIIAFYEVLQLGLKDISLAELFLILVEDFEGEFYLRSSTDYWKVRLHYPYMGLDWAPAKLPSHSQPQLLQHPVNNAIAIAE